MVLGDSVPLPPPLPLPTTSTAAEAAAGLAERADLQAFLASAGLGAFESVLVKLGAEAVEDLCDATLVTDALLAEDAAFTPADVRALRRAAAAREARGAEAARAAAVAASFRPVSGHWRAVGFSDADPSLEFRGCGRLGLLAVAHVAAHPHVSRPVNPSTATPPTRALAIYLPI